MDDLISRQAAIDAVIEWYGCEPNDIDAFKEIIYNKSSAQPEILACGSGELNAQSEQRWILVTERLPEIDMSHPHHEDYLVQYDSGGIDVASWSNVNRFWTDHVTEPHWNCVQFATVIAWMPLPEPYKEGKA